MFSLVITLVVAALSFGLGVAVAGRAVRATLPEKLPTPAQSIPQLERAEQKRLQDEQWESGWREEGDVN